MYNVYRFFIQYRSKQEWAYPRQTGGGGEEMAPNQHHQDQHNRKMKRRLNGAHLKLRSTASPKSTTGDNSRDVIIQSVLRISKRLPPTQIACNNRFKWIAIRIVWEEYAITIINWSVCSYLPLLISIVVCRNLFICISFSASFAVTGIHNMGLHTRKHFHVGR